MSLKYQVAFLAVQNVCGYVNPSSSDYCRGHSRLSLEATALYLHDKHYDGKNEKSVHYITYLRLGIFVAVRLLVLRY